MGGRPCGYPFSETRNFVKASTREEKEEDKIDDGDDDDRQSLGEAVRFDGG